MKKFLAITCLSLAVLSACLSNRLFLRDNENKRLRENQESLMEDVRFYETSADESAASVLRLQLTYGELEKHYNAICSEAKDLGLTVKRLQSVSQSSTKTNIKVVTKLRDTISHVIKNDIVYLDTIKRFSWKDEPWVNVEGIIDSGLVDIDIHTVDTIVQYVHKVPKRFLFFKWGTKAIRQEVISKNPYSKILYSKYIELSK